MQIVQIPGLTLENSKVFFNTFKISHTDVATFFAWQNLEDPIKSLSKLIFENLSSGKVLVLHAKSYGSYIAVQAIEHARSENPDLNFSLLKLDIFGLPYRLGYPPNAEVLNNLEIEFSDESLAIDYLVALQNVNVPVTIYQGDSDDLGPINFLESQVQSFNNIRLVRLFGQSHNIDPKTIKFDSYEQS